MSRTADAVVAGAGVVGLCAATALSRAGLGVVLVGEEQPGEASRAAAGMLAPSVERAAGPAHEFAIAARDFYPGFIERLRESTGASVALNRLGILQVALTPAGERGLRRTISATSRWLDRGELTDLEPALAHAIGAVLNPLDGAVDNVALLRALELEIVSSQLVQRVEGLVTAVTSGPHGVTIRLASGEKLAGGHAVLAPGAWGGRIAGAKALRHVTPSRGQMVAWDAETLQHVVYGPRGYVVPRPNGSTIAGSTMENVGFDAGTTEAGLARVRSAAEEILPSLASIQAGPGWAGLRPVTPDMLPIIGRDPDQPHVVYACGHSRNGILLAPLTGETVAAIVTGQPAKHDLTQFRPDRF